jgi:hypothetical protein
MTPLHRLVRASVAKALYSPFGLAWLRARDLNTPSTAYRDAQWPTPSLMISAIRVVQSFWPPRRSRSAAYNLSPAGPETFYAASVGADACRPIVAQTSTGPIIRISGHVTHSNMGSVLLAISRVQADWPQAAWELDTNTLPAWLKSALLLATSAPKLTGIEPCITLAPPAHDDEIDAFVAQALGARELSR